MSAPSDVRVEALSLTSVILRWTYGGAAAIAVYRSTDGIAYSAIGGTDAATKEFTDTGLSTGTKYWYKLSDDGGSTFSSVVTVFTQACGESPTGDTDIILPRVGEEVDSRTFNDLAVRVETGLVRFTDPDGRTCIACIVDGALVIDCVHYANCDIVEVNVDQDVNSISMPNCENGIQQIDFLIPPGTLRQICGWPAGMGFTGDECFRAPISGGTEGRRVSVPTRQRNSSPLARTKPGVVRGTGTGGQGAVCTCVPTANGGLTIKSCNANNSLDCRGTKKLQLKACGGRGPYTWSKTSSITLSKTTGDTIVVTPEANPGPAVSGTAYHLYGKFAFADAGTCTQVSLDRSYGCNDAEISCTSNTCAGFAPTCNNTFPAGCQTLPCLSCSTAGGNTCLGTGGATPCFPVSPRCDNNTCADKSQGGNMCDTRSGPMIAAGCEPCGVKAGGATVTVTDSLGTQTTIILRA